MTTVRQPRRRTAATKRSTTKRAQAARAQVFTEPVAEGQTRDLAPLFSPATFYDVIASSRGPGPTEEPLGTLTRPAIVAFYGFRGGAGRTMALGHVAAGLARRGLGVAAIDLDLEAPGLNSVLGVQSAPGRGAIYLLREA